MREEPHSPKIVQPAPGGVTQSDRPPPDGHGQMTRCGVVMTQPFKTESGRLGSVDRFSVFSIPKTQVLFKDLTCHDVFLKNTAQPQPEQLIISAVLHVAWRSIKYKRREWSGLGDGPQMSSRRTGSAQCCHQSATTPRVSPPQATTGESARHKRGRPGSAPAARASA